MSARLVNSCTLHFSLSVHNVLYDNDNDNDGDDDDDNNNNNLLRRLMSKQ
jgi:hypothetical protein